MTINELYNIWYDGNRNDINFVNTCWNMLGCILCYTYEDDIKYKQLYDTIKDVMEDWLHDHK